MKSIELCCAMLLTISGSAVTAEAETLKVLVAGGFKTAMQEIAPLYEQSSGNKLDISYATPAVSREKIKESGIDAAVVAEAVLKDPEQAGQLAPGTRLRVAQAEIGIGVPLKSVAKIDTSDIEAFKASLNTLNSIAFSDPKAGTALANTVFSLAEKAGFGDDLRSRAKLINAPGDEVSKAVGNGEADAVITLASDIATVPGVRLIGLLPKDLQQQFPFDGVVMKQSPHASVASDFLAFLRRPEAMAIATKAGLTVPR